MKLKRRISKDDDGIVLTILLCLLFSTTILLFSSIIYIFVSSAIRPGLLVGDACLILVVIFLFYFSSYKTPLTPNPLNWLLPPEEKTKVVLLARHEIAEWCKNNCRGRWKIWNEKTYSRFLKAGNYFEYGAIIVSFSRKED
jgi:hypothetical protein